jgi:hypothetical protein
MSDFNIYECKRRIINSIKDLDKTDYNDICMIIKSNASDLSMVTVTVKGTYIDLDRMEIEMLKQLDNIIKTKLQRISLQK